MHGTSFLLFEHSTAKRSSFLKDSFRGDGAVVESLYLRFVLEPFYNPPLKIIKFLKKFGLSFVLRRELYLPEGAG